MDNFILKSFLVLTIAGSFQVWKGVQSQHIDFPFTRPPDQHQAWDAIRHAVESYWQETGDVYDTASLIHDLVVALKSSSFPTAVASNVSKQCLEDSQNYVHSLYQNRSLWALQMQESSGQIPPGLFGSANIHADGLFDECQAIDAPNFKGQYCTVSFKPEPVHPQFDTVFSNHQNEEHDERGINFLTIFQLVGFLSGSDRVEPKRTNADGGTANLPSISICLPSSCSANDLGQAVAELIGSYIIANNSIVTVTDEQYCFKEDKKPPPLDAANICFIVLMSLIGTLIIAATVHEAWRMYCDVGFNAKNDATFVSVLHCFSLLNNGRKLLSMKVSTSGDNFGCIHGIRFFSTCWVVLGHTWDALIYKSMNPKAVHSDALNWGFQIIGNATVSVDTFFVMSGLLVSFLLLKELERNKGRFNVGLFYLHRYLRLTPVFALIIGFIATLMVYLGTGPNWYTVQQFSDGCRNDWWRRLLYINNLFPRGPDRICVGPTWYLAVDMQLFLISPLLIWPLWRWRRMGHVWMAVVMLASHAVIFTLFAVHDFKPTLIPTRFRESFTSTERFFDIYYVKPWSRAPPYLIGIWLGWYFQFTKKSPVHVGKFVVIFGWVLAAVVGLAVLFGMVPYVDMNKVPEIDPIVKMTYGPLHRTAWGLVIAWIIYACSHGYGGFVNRFLSWKGFIPLGRVTYCVYLIHYDYINIFSSAIRKQFYYNMFGQFNTYFGILVIVFGLAFMTSMALEASFLNLEKLLFSFKTTPEKRQEVGSGTNNGKSAL